MARNSQSSGNDRGLVSVLVVRFSAMGDVAMTVPVLYSACRCYPDVNFVMVTRPAMTGFFVNAPANLTVVGADVKNDYKGPSGLRRLTSELIGQYKPDCMLDLHNVLRTKIMSFFCRLRGVRVVTINKGRANKRALTRQRNKIMLPLDSSRARYRAVFHKAGLPVSERFNGLYDGPAKADTTLFDSISAPKRPGVKWVGIAPFAAHRGKIYPPGKMEVVVASLSEKNPDTEIFLFGGGGDEKKILDTWESKYPRVRNLAGKKYGFKAELALINHLDVMVSMDSANMHLASITATPTISIWGATHSYCGFRGWRQSDSDMIQLPMTCRPCSVFGDKPCQRGDYLCMTAIKPEVIYKKILDKIDIR